MLSDLSEPPDEIIQAGLDGDLVLFVGAGASMLLGLPSWNGLAKNVLEDLRKEGYLDYSEVQELQTQDAKKQLSIAYLIAEDNNYQIRIEEHLHLKGVVEGESIYKALNDIGCLCITTNYDELLAPRYIETKDGSTTTVPVNRVSDRDKFVGKLLNEPGTVIHLHGSVSFPEQMIVTTKNYLEHYDNENVKEFLGDLFATKVVVFLGYGLEESEILEHILRRGGVHVNPERKRFALQGFFQSQVPLYEHLHKYYERSFGVHLLGFERDTEDYMALERIVKSWVPHLEIRKAPMIVDVMFMDEVLGDE